LPGRVCMPQTTCLVKDFGPGGRARRTRSQATLG